MPPDSGNSNDLDVDTAGTPIPIERRPDPDALVIPTEEPVEDLPPLQTSNKLTFYSAASDVRYPVQLIRDIFSDFWLGRELAWRLFLRNVRGLYRQTLLGLFWAFLPPIANTLIWVFLMKVSDFDPGDMPISKSVYILTGMILWQAFVDAFQMPLGALNKNKNMISRLNFPRESLLLVGIGEVLFDLMIRMSILIPVFLIFGITFHATLLLVPFAVVALVLWGAALGLFIMPFGSLYQDVGRFIGMVLPFWMIVTPIVYLPFKDYPGTLLNWLNPASPLILLARDWLLLGSFEHLVVGIVFGIVSIPAALLGLIVYRVSIPVLVERMTA